jgi:FixJ family two-component response regulator
MIAIVGNDEIVRESTKVLVEALGYEALTFSSAQDFLQSDRLQTVSCLITDVQMPGQSGLDTTTPRAKS